MKGDCQSTRRSAARCFATAAIAVAVMLCPGLAFAQPSLDPATVVKQKIEQRYPDVHVLGVQPSPVAGVFEIYTGNEIVYSDAQGEYLIGGPIVSTATRQNLTESRLSDLGRVDFKTLPFNQAIKIVKGNGARQFAVFSDPDCPYCQSLEKSLLSVNDFTMYVFLFPIAQLHPQAPAKSHSIWCAKDHSQAWSQWMQDKKLPPAVATCPGDPVVQLAQLGNRLHINSTPTIFFASGRRVAGAIPVQSLEQELATPAPATSHKP